MQYKAIGFDWGGVIKGHLGSNFTKEICKLISEDPETYRIAYFNHNKDVNRGDISWPELWSLVLSDLGKLKYLDQVLELNAERDTNLPSQINNKMMDLVDKIRSSGYKTGLLSNNTLKAGIELRELGMDNHFDVFHISAETRLVKPEPQAFNLFIKELNVEPNELIFIDDAVKSLSTSNECGYTPILFESYDNLVDKLHELKII